VGDIIVGIDIGTSKVCTMIGSVGKNNRLNILGTGLSACTGLKKGMIVDIDSTVASIKSSVEKAERSSNLKISSAYLNIHGMHISIISNSASIDISNENGEITRNDIDNVLYAASSVEIPEDRQLIDIKPIQYIIDGYGGITDPLGMVGKKLEVEVDVLAGKIASVQNIIRCIEKAGLQIDGIITEVLAVGEIALTTEEKEAGVMLIDIGGSLTEVSVFKGNELIYYDTVLLGGNHITNDIALSLNISSNEAEKIKRQYELALTSLIKNDQEINVFDTKENKRKTVKISEVVEIIEARVSEIFYLCLNKAEKAGVLESIPSGIVLTGAGISYVDGNKQIAESIFNLPVRVVKPKDLGLTKTEHITAAGIIKYVHSTGKNNSTVTDIKLLKNNGKRKKGSIIAKFFEAIKGMF